jgi:hypothetical protein
MGEQFTASVIRAHQKKRLGSPRKKSLSMTLLISANDRTIPIDMRTDCA